MYAFQVERHYEDYYHHMEKTVSSFEVIAGSGVGKCYTVLALQAMSKHFCSSRNAILFQIHVMRKKIKKNMPRFSSVLSDQEARHNRMSLRIIQTSRQVCRPIRGPPETSVTIFRAWLFEHFLHPYVLDFLHNFKFAPKRCLLKIYFFSDILMTQKSLCWYHKQACQRTKYLVFLFKWKLCYKWFPLVSTILIFTYVFNDCFRFLTGS